MIPIRVCVIDDHPMIVKVISETISEQHDMKVAGTADHGIHLERLIVECSPDIVVLDLGMSKGPDWEPAVEVKKMLHKYPQVKIIVVSAYDDAGNIKAMSKAGVSGYILKSEAVDSITKAIRTVFKGGRWYSQPVVDVLVSEDDLGLTDQELVVLQLLAKGHSNKIIGDELEFSEQTVKNLLSSIYAKLEIDGDKNRRVFAVVEARKRGLIPSD
jgi:NarL family two-component system response regulator LiaR